MTTKNNRDTARLHAALAAVREQVPAATALDLQTSDQHTYGFVLHEIRVGEYELSELDSELFTYVETLIADDLSALNWDGIVGEDQHGCATLTL